MKILAASDIHGDSYWASAVIEKFHETGSDKLLLLGDLLYHGPRNNLPENYNPGKVIALLNAEAGNILAVRGNCDTEVDQMVLKFPIMADYIYLVSGETVFFATHGHHYSPDNLPEGLGAGSVFLSGHTHVACDYISEKSDGIRCMNPGSPSIPKQDTNPSYIMIKNGEARLERF